ncbi:MAG: transposase [Acidimicrobiales bacterium]
MANLIVEVIGGVGTHKELHAAAALDRLGGVLATAEFRTTARGYIDLLRWLRSFGHVVAVGVEGTGSWGAGLARFLAVEGVNVVEVNRPDRTAPPAARQDRHGRRDRGRPSRAGRHRNQHAEVNDWPG